MHPDGTLDLGRRVRDLVHPLRERWHLVVLCAVLTCAAAVGYSMTQEERYESTAKLLIQEDGFDASIVGLDRGQQVDPERQTATDLALFRQYPLAERVVEETGADVSPKALLNHTTVEADGPSRVVEVTVNDPDPDTAAALATTYAQQYVRFRAANARQRYQRALGDIDERLQALQAAGVGRVTARRQLREQRDQVALLSSLQSGDATVIEPARASGTPVSPDLVRNGVLGLLVGLILGGMLAIARERIDPRLREERQVTELLPGVPLIAAIPNSPVDYSGRPVEAEGFRGLQTTLSVLDADRAIRTVLVTSATVAEGKSTTSLSLALAMVEREESVVLMEGDLRRRTLSERLGLGEHEGLSEVLAGETTVGDQLVEVSLDPPTRARVGVGGRGTTPLSGVVQVLPAGAATSNPHALLSPMRLQRALLEASALADKVVVDGTPLGLVKDMLPVATQADAVVVVARLHHTRRRELERLRDLLASARVEPFGLVLFGVEPDVAYNAYLGRR